MASAHASRPYILLAIGLSLLGFVMPLAALVALLLWGMVLLRSFRSFTLVESIVLSFLAVLANIIALYSLVTVFGWHLPVRYALPLLALVYTSLGVYGVLRRGLKLQIDWQITKSDIAAGMVAIFCFCMLLVPIINQNGATVARFLSFGEDNGSHYALSRYEYRHGQLAYQQDADHAGLIKSLEIYPQGFHISAAVLASLTQPKSINEAGFVKIYAIFITLFYSLFVFWLAKLCTFRRETSSFILLAFLPALALLGGLSNFILMLDRGFQPQIFAYMFLTAITFIVAKLKPRDKTALSGVYFGLLLCVGIAASWWFMLFVAGILLLVFCLRGGLLQPLLQSWRQYWPAKLILVFAILYPIIINILLNAKKDPISEQGGVDKLQWTILGYLLVPAAILLAWQYSRLRRKLFNQPDLYYVLTGLLAACAMAVLIGGYHKLRLGYFEYFFYKSIYAVLLFAIILFFIAAISFSDDLFKKLPRFWRWLIPIAVLAATWIIAWQTNMVYLRVYIHNWFPQTVDAVDAEPLFSADSSQYRDILYVGDCDLASDYLSNRWSGARLLSANHDRSELVTSALLLDPSKADALLRTYLKKHSGLLLLVDKRCAYKLPYLQTVSSNKNITVRYTH